MAIICPLGYIICTFPKESFEAFIGGTIMVSGGFSKNIVLTKSFKRFIGFLTPLLFYVHFLPLFALLALLAENGLDLK